MSLKGGFMDLELTNRTVLVTGSYRGTGLIIAEHFLNEGCRVFVHGLVSGQAEKAVAEIGGGDPVTGDISTSKGTEELLAQLDRTPEILVNNFGTASSGSWKKSQDEDWLDMYQKNVLSAQRLIQSILPHMAGMPFARIINLGTVGSSRPNNSNPHYYASKGALSNMTIGLAREVAGTNIRVNLVSPGLILTPEVKSSYLKRAAQKDWGSTWSEVEPKITGDIPIGRITRREEVADLILFLCSTKADAIHGQNIMIDGGSYGVVT